MPNPPSGNSHFFQALEGSPRKDVFVGTGLVRLDYPLSGPALALHGGLGEDLYDGFDPSLQLFLGGRLNRGVHAVEADASFRTRSPRGDVGDAVGWADVLLASLGLGNLRALRALEAFGEEWARRAGGVGFWVGRRGTVGFRARLRRGRRA